MDISYYKKFIKFDNNNKGYISEMSQNLSNQRNNAVSPFSILINSNQAKDITLNNIPYKAVIIVKVLKDTVIKTLQMNQGIMKYGDYFQYYNDSTKKYDTYLVKSKVEAKLLDYDEAFIQVCNSSLKLKTVINNVETLITIPAIISNGILNVKENKYFDVLDNKLTCQVGTSMANQIKYIKDTGIVTRLILGNKNYKVLGVDNVTNVINNSGIITIKLDSDISIEGDDFVNGIAKNVMDEVIIIPPVLDLYTLVTSTTATNSDFINLGLTRYQKVVNADWAVCNKGEIFVFSLEQSDKNPLINPNQLVTSMTGIQNTQCILTANNVGIRGYFFIVATFGNIIIKRELRVKAISDI